MNTVSIHSTEPPRLKAKSFTPDGTGHLRTQQVPGVGPDAPVTEYLANAARATHPDAGKGRSEQGEAGGEENQDRAGQYDGG